METRSDFRGRVFCWKDTEMAKGNTAKRHLRPATQLVHGGTLRSQFGENSEAMFLTQSYVYDSAEQAERRFKGEEPGFIYSRYANPTVAMFEERMRLLEGAGAARATASGMAAVTSVFLSWLKAGDHVVAAKALFGSCRYVDRGPAAALRHQLDAGRRHRPQAVEARRRARTPRRSSSKARPTRRSTSSTSRRSPRSRTRPAPSWSSTTSSRRRSCRSRCKLGADVVVYSATKHIDGQGRVLGGVILSDEKFIADNLHTFLRQTGPSLSPFNAWVLLKGLETLPVRVERQSATAAKLADRLAAHKRVGRVLYPGRADHPQADIVKRQMTGGSTLIAFEVKGGRKAAFRCRTR